MNPILLRTGHGHESGTYGRCEAFDGIHILANPLGGFDEAGRESRVFGKQPNGNGGVTYASHMLALGCHEFDKDKQPGRRDLLLLLHHGGGRSVFNLGRFYDCGDLERHILAMPERVQYALLHQMARLAQDARREAISATESRWAAAHVEKRLKTKRHNGRKYVQIESAQGDAVTIWETAA